MITRFSLSNNIRHNSSGKLANPAKKAPGFSGANTMVADAFVTTAKKAPTLPPPPITVPRVIIRSVRRLVDAGNEGLGPARKIFYSGMQKIVIVFKDILRSNIFK